MDSSSSHPIIELIDIKKQYQMGDVISNILNQISFKINTGEYVCIMGPSGCGKSTLLNLLGCLDQPCSGQYKIDGINVAQMDDDTLSATRNKNLGFIFQSYNLIQQLNVLENIGLAMTYSNKDEKLIQSTTQRLATRVGLGHRMYHRPSQLSGGQQQRVAIARALANDPLLILADEATGNLDSKSGQEILNLFDELNQEGRTLVFVTHDERMVERCTRVIRLNDGWIESDTLTTLGKSRIQAAS
jgi:putative ABC transport system ATP-binding protein